MIEESYFDDLDRSFLNLSSQMAGFFSWTYRTFGYRLVAPLGPDKFDNSTSKVKEIATRALIVLGGALSLWFAGLYIVMGAVVLGAACKLFRGVGFALQKEGFTHVRGSAPEIALENGQAKVMTWNLRGHSGGLHYEHGVIHWQSRVDRIVENIQAEQPDVIVLQEIYDTALVEKLVSQLGDQYAHFFTQLGKNTWGNTGGCMVITKCAVQRFTHTDFSNNDWQVNRGFETLEIKASPQDASPCARIIGTQLAPGKEAQEKRMEQVAQIVDALGRETFPMPTLFVGSLGIDRDSKEEGKLLTKYLYHSYRDKYPTQSDELGMQWAPIFDGQEESNDYISFFKRQTAEGKILPVIEKNIRMLNCHLVKGFDEDYNTKTALSDHHAVVTEFNGLRAL